MIRNDADKGPKHGMQYEYSVHTCASATTHSDATPAESVTWEEHPCAACIDVPVWL